MGAKTSWLMLVVTPLCCFINIPPQSVSLETSYQWVIRAGIPARSRSQRKSWKRWTKWNSGEKEHTIMLLYIHIIYYIILYYIVYYIILYYIVYYIILYYIVYYIILYCILYYIILYYIILYYIILYYIIYIIYIYIIIYIFIYVYNHIYIYWSLPSMVPHLNKIWASFLRPRLQSCTRLSDPVHCGPVITTGKVLLSATSLITAVAELSMV